MKKQLLVLFSIALLFTACSKSKDEPEVAKKTVTGTKWESFWFTASGGEKFYYRLNFTTDSDVEYFITYIDDKSVTSPGKTTLKYTIDDPTKAFPVVHIIGTLNGVDGTPGKGEKIDYTLTYSPEVGSAKASLSMKDRYYTKY